MDAWNKLSKEDQEVLQTAALEESEIQWERAAAEDEKFRNKLKDEYNWEIVILTPEELNVMAAQVRKLVWPKMEELVGKELMDRIYTESGIAKP